MRFQKLFITMSALVLLGGCVDLRAKRTLNQATMLAQSKVILLQNTMRAKNFFDLQTLNKIFHKNALAANVSAEEKMRSFYKIAPDVQISLLGELLKIACPEICSIELKDNCFFIKNIASKKDFEYIEGIIVCEKKILIKNAFFQERSCGLQNRFGKIKILFNAIIATSIHYAFWTNRESSARKTTFAKNQWGSA